jgi:hypothetical protein
VKLDGRAAYFYVLLEHQSTADRRMPLRILRYMIQIWDEHLRAHPDALLLPPIVPVVVHHSAGGWTAPVAFADLLDVSADLRASLGRHLPSFEFLLDDVSEVEDEELRGRAITTLARIALFCLARARTSGDFLSELRRWSDALSELVEAPNGVAALSMVVSYILQVTDTPPEHLRSMLSQLGPKAEEASMTGEQMLIEKYRAEWLAEGRVEGRAEGRAEMLLRQLSVKFGPVSAEIEQRVRSADVAELDVWAERVLGAQAIDDVFRLER